MTDVQLTDGETIQLLRELATNDDFRAAYSTDPAAALLELGVPQTTVAGMNSICFLPCVLASKQEFLEALELASTIGINRSQSMAIPKLRLVARPDRSHVGAPTLNRIL
ncbi:MAG TPA: NHLP-related RiPP peptide [Dokdonella sp.]